MHRDWQCFQLPEETHQDRQDTQQPEETQQDAQGTQQPEETQRDGQGTQQPEETQQDGQGLLQGMAYIPNVNRGSICPPSPPQEPAQADSEPQPELAIVLAKQPSSPIMKPATAPASPGTTKPPEQPSAALPQQAQVPTAVPLPASRGIPQPSDLVEQALEGSGRHRPSPGTKPGSGMHRSTPRGSKQSSPSQ